MNAVSATSQCLRKEAVQDEPHLTLLSALVLVLAAMVTAACSSREAKEPVVAQQPVEQTVQVQEPVADLVEEPAAIQVVDDPEPVAEPPEEPAVVPPPEVATQIPEPEVPSANPVPGSCLILEEKFCDNGTMVRRWGYYLAMFRLPPGTLIFAPWSGKVKLGDFSSISRLPLVLIHLDANGNQVIDPEEVKLNIEGDLEILPGVVEHGVVYEGHGFIIAGDYLNVVQGEPIARMTDTGATVYEDFNLQVVVTRYNPAKDMFVPIRELTQELLPALSSN